MSNYHLRDKSLSLKAKGLLSMMLSMPKDWDYSIVGLEKISQEGKYAIRTTLDELKRSEYVKISRYRDEKGLFRYKYIVYYLPYSMWLKTHNYPDINYPYMDDPNTDNCTQINIYNKKDKIDKIKTNRLDDYEHNILTNELIKRDFITKDDSNSFLFDDLFQDLLNQGRNYKELMIMVNYIISKLKERNFKDEDGNEIKNKYGYFKAALNSNINKFDNQIDSEDLFNPDDYDWLDEKEDDYEL